MVQTAETGSKHIKNYFLGFLYLSGFYLFLNTLFFLISLMTDLDILCSDSHNFLKEINKKITKETNKKVFGGPSKISKNISWSIIICLNRPLQKPSGTPLTYLMYGPLGNCESRFFDD